MQWRSQGGKGQSATRDSKKNCQKSVKRRGKSGKSGKKRGKLGRKGKNQEGSSTLPLLTDRAGYATVSMQEATTLDHTSCVKMLSTHWFLFFV